MKFRRCRQSAVETDCAGRTLNEKRSGFAPRFWIDGIDPRTHIDGLAFPWQAKIEIDPPRFGDRQIRVEFFNEREGRFGGHYNSPRAYGDRLDWGLLD